VTSDEHVDVGIARSMVDYNNNSVLVTGGRGFIGRAVGKLLQRSGYAIISLDQTEMALPDRQNCPHEVVCDIRDAARLERVFETERIGGIIHLAAILPTAAQRDPLRATQVNVEGSLHVLELARRFGVRRVVFGSSLSVYGTCSADNVVSEQDRAAPEDLYGAAKLYVEQLGQVYARDALSFVSLRIGRVVGAGARSATSAWRSEIFELLGAREARDIVLPYVGSERLLLVHVDDVARALVMLLHSPRPEHGVYNAPCESVAVNDLKRFVEGLNSNIHISVGEALAAGNPRRLDCSRFQTEFGFATLPVFEQLHKQPKK
jgi:nucleoside-diphosphate-sugar epimerase